MKPHVVGVQRGAALPRRRAAAVLLGAGPALLLGAAPAHTGAAGRREQDVALAAAASVASAGPVCGGAGPAAGLAMPGTEPPRLAELSPVALPDSAELRWRDAAGREDRLLIARPPAPPPPGGHPLLVLLDGDVLFPLAAALLRQAAARPDGAQWHWPVLLGLGRTTEPGYDQAAREADFPPGPGADALLARLRQHWLPWLGRELALDVRQRTLFGHSYGGLFTLYALFSQPGWFRHHVAASPSIWWGQRAILPWAERFQSDAARGADPLRSAWPAEAPPSLWLCAGSREEDGTDADPQRRQRQRERRPVSAARELAQQLAQQQAPAPAPAPAPTQARTATPAHPQRVDLSVRFELLDGLDHGGVVLPALQHALLRARLPRTPLPSELPR